ncbi:MAG: hypothetical protein MZV70_37320 [Desulfobacterales bacterium]|nr:hypothetical protein [Desulfobacterales bacterium]
MMSAKARLSIAEALREAIRGRDAARPAGVLHRRGHRDPGRVGRRVHR